MTLIKVRLFGLAIFCLVAAPVAFGDEGSFGSDYGGQNAYSREYQGGSEGGEGDVPPTQLSGQTENDSNSGVSPPEGGNPPSLFDGGDGRPSFQEDQGFGLPEDSGLQYLTPPSLGPNPSSDSQAASN
jgi:hypothetical protein